MSRALSVMITLDPRRPAVNRSQFIQVLLQFITGVAFHVTNEVAVLCFEGFECPRPYQGIVGAITGRAIYEGTLDLSSAQSLADELSGVSH